MAEEQHDTIDDLSTELRRFPPPDGFKADALVTGTDLYDEAAEDDEGFWAGQASELIAWSKPWDTILEWDLPYAKWFVGGELNVSYNCLDRHVEAGRGDKVAFHWEGEPGDSRTITYAELLDDVQRFANVLKSLGVAKGDRVNIYMPMIPEVAVAMLACARIGAAHSVVFGGFSAQALADRINDAEATVLITADGGYRRGEVFPLKAAADEAVANAPTIEHVVVVKRGGNDVTMVDGRDHWYHDLMEGADPDCPAEPMDSEQLLFLLYTSGTTGKPKGIMHTSGGYLTHVAYTHKYVFDLHPDTDIFWCTADVGWVTGHSYIVYGPLANGATQVMYEGVPNFPGNDRLWAIVEKYGVTILYTAPTAIRTFMKWGVAEPDSHDLTSLRLLGSVGEPINPEAWMWYQEHIGGGRCPIVDTWWQTETGGIMISPLPGRHDHQARFGHVPVARRHRPNSSTTPVERVERGGGYLTLTRPWPGMLRGIWGDPERYRRDLLEPLPRPVLRRRRRQARRRRLPVAARPGRRRDERVRASHLDHRGRVGARRRTRAWPRPRWSAPTTPTTGQAIIAYVILRGGAEVGVEELRDHVGRRDRRDRQAEDDLHDARPPEDPRRARSCVASCATWPRGATSATPRPSPTSTVVDELQRRATAGDGDE